MELWIFRCLTLVLFIAMVVLIIRQHRGNSVLKNMRDVLAEMEQGEEKRRLLAKGNGMLADICYAINSITARQNKQIDTLQHSDREYRKVLAGLSHDLRTPLTSLIGYLDAVHEQAVIAMVDSNVQRENILPSEKAFAYKMKLEAIKRQGKRSDLSSTQVAQKWSAAKIGEESGESKDQVRRYIRLTELIPPLLHMVDDKRIAFNPAVELSHLLKEQQELVYSTMESEQSTPSLSQARKLKALSADEKLNEAAITDVMREQKANQKEQVRIPYDKVRAIVKKDMPPKELENFILKAVTDYQKKIIRQEQNRNTR